MKKIIIPATETIVKSRDNSVIQERSEGLLISIQEEITNAVEQNKYGIRIPIKINYIVPGFTKSQTENRIIYNILKGMENSGYQYHLKNITKLGVVETFLVVSWGKIIELEEKKIEEYLKRFR